MITYHKILIYVVFLIFKTDSVLTWTLDLTHDLKFLWGSCIRGQPKHNRSQTKSQLFILIKSMVHGLDTFAWYNEKTLHKHDC